MTRILFKVTSKLLLTSAALTLSLAATAIASSSLEVGNAQDSLPPLIEPQKRTKIKKHNLTVSTSSVERASPKASFLDPNSYSSPAQSMSIISLSPQSQKNSKRNSLTRSPKKKSPVTKNSPTVIPPINLGALSPAVFSLLVTPLVIPPINLGALSPVSPHEAIEKKQKELQKQSSSFIDSELFAYVLGEKFQQKAQGRKYTFKFEPRKEQEQYLTFLNDISQKVRPTLTLNIASSSVLEDTNQQFNREFITFLEKKTAIDNKASLIVPANKLFSIFDEDSKKFFTGYDNKSLAYLHLQIGKLLRHLYEIGDEEKNLNAQRGQNPFVRGTNGYEGLILSHFFLDKILKNLHNNYYQDIVSVQDFASSVLYQQAETHMHLAIDTYWLSSPITTEKEKKIYKIHQKAAQPSADLMTFYLCASCIYKPTIYTVSKAIRLLAEDIKKAGKAVNCSADHLETIVMKLFFLSLEKDSKHSNFQVSLDQEKKLDLFHLKIIGANETGEYSIIKKNTPSVIQIELGKASQYLSSSHKTVQNKIQSLAIIRPILETAAQKGKLFDSHNGYLIEYTFIQSLTFNEKSKVALELKKYSENLQEENLKKLMEILHQRFDQESNILNQMISQVSGLFYNLNESNLQDIQQELQKTNSQGIVQIIVKTLSESKELKQELERLFVLTTEITKFQSQIIDDFDKILDLKSKIKNHESLQKMIKKWEEKSSQAQKNLQIAWKTIESKITINQLGDIKKAIKLLQENIFFSQETQDILDVLNEQVKKDFFSEETNKSLEKLNTLYSAALKKELLTSLLEGGREKSGNLDALITAQNKLEILAQSLEDPKKKVIDFLSKIKENSEKGKEARDYMQQSLKSFYFQTLSKEFDLSLNNAPWTPEARIIMLAKFYEDARDKKGFFKEEQERKQQPKKKK